MQEIYSENTPEYQIKVWQCPDEWDTLKPIEKQSQQKEFITKKIKTIFSGTVFISYNSNGKPELSQKESTISLPNISISHSHNYYAIIIHKKYAGIDIEKQREQLHKIKNRFLHPEELQVIGASLSDLCKAWTIKEAVYKTIGKENISLKDNIRILSNLNHSFIQAKIMFENQEKYFQLKSIPINDFILSHVVKEIK